MLALASCKKDEVTAPPNYSKFAGNYYGIVTYDVFSFTSATESDCILPTEVNGSQLTFGSANFYNIIDSELSFSYGDMYYGGAILTYSPNYDHIQFEELYDAGGPKVKKKFNGDITELPVTGPSEHPLKNQLEGTFILQIDKHENVSGLDVSYIDTVVVSLAGYSPVIDNITYSIGVFYTYYKHNDTYNQQLQYRDLYWVEDSLYLNYKYVPAGTTDTTHHIFSGRKL